MNPDEKIAFHPADIKLTNDIQLTNLISDLVKKAYLQLAAEKAHRARMALTAHEELQAIKAGLE